MDPVPPNADLYSSSMRMRIKGSSTA